MTLNELPMPQSRGKIFEIAGLIGEQAATSRLEELGFFQGAKIEVLTRLPLKGPWIVSLGTASFALRADEAATLELR